MPFRTIPQSETIVASLGVKALEGLIANVLALEREDFDSLMETRGMLEIQAARLAAERADAAMSAHMHMSQRQHRTRPAGTA